jgi:catechol 2,3-dioxygenase-like lactoylglutathione lyase family enzyme
VTPILQDREEAINFYGNLLKLTVPEQRGNAPAFGAYGNGAPLLKMVGMPNNWMGVLTLHQPEVRFVMARVPGSAMQVELENFRNIDRQPVKPRPQDPGAVTLVVLVRDIEKAFEPFKTAGVGIVTPGNALVPMDPESNPKARSVLLSDDNGHFVELRQPDPLPPTSAPANSNIIGAMVRLTIRDTDETLKFYRDGLGMPVTVGSFGDHPLLDVMGLHGAEMRLTTAQIPGSALRLEFAEIRGVDRTPIQARLQDPGATRFTLRVKNIETTMKRLEGPNVSVTTAGGEPVRVGNSMTLVVRDPNGLYVQFQAPI